jgi:hypothetical protein
VIVGIYYLPNKSVLKQSFVHLFVLSIFLYSSQILYAQENQEAPLSQEGPISLNFPDNMDLKLLIEYISDRLNLNIIYDHRVDS